MASDTIYSIFGHAISSGQVLVASAVMLFLSGVLFIFSRKRRVKLERSWATDELMLHLSRIADSLDHLAARPPVVVQSGKLEDGTSAAAVGTEARTIPYSMFGREFQQGH
jgi:hypothetical protein